MNYTLPQLLKALVDQGGSDLHISSETPPRMRIHGDLLPLELPPLDSNETKQLCYSVLTEEQRRDFEAGKELDLAFSVKNLSRFRANIFMQKSSVSGVFRAIPLKIHTLDELLLPPVLKNLCNTPRGLILVTGPTGSGKSTTLAAMVNHINENHRGHILTIEDPVEFIHPHKSCSVNQREVGHDTQSFGRALKSALREDPDVILVGELRDLETVSLALTAAETGHLVLASLHTNSCVSTLNRIIDVFPPHQQSQVRTQISLSLSGILSQALLPALSGGRVLAMEILIPSKAIRNLLREDKVHQIYSAMQTGQEDSGMQTMNKSLLHLINRRMITIEQALEKSNEPDELAEILSKRDLSTPSTGAKTKPGLKKGA